MNAGYDNSVLERILQDRPHGVGNMCVVCVCGVMAGAPKGDGLVTYLKEPSVALAVQLLDGAPFRPDSKVMMTVGCRRACA